MSDINNDDNFMETLRLKTEEADVKQYLKTNLGGYTKSSVMEYLSILRKQQQAMAETFSRNQQLLFDEKEKLQKNNDVLTLRFSQVESEYKNLAASMRNNELLAEDSTAEDIMSLKNNIAALEDGLSKNEMEKSHLSKKIEQQDDVINDYTTKLEQSAQEKQALKEMLKAEMIESKKQRNTAIQLSGTIEEKDQEIKFLRSKMADGQLAILSSKIKELMQQIEDQTAEIAECNNRNELQEQVIATITNENNTLEQSIAGLVKNIDDIREQNEKLLFINQSLTAQLENEYKRSIELIKEKSAIATEKFAAVRQFEQANAKVSILELQLAEQKNNQQHEPAAENPSQMQEGKVDFSLDTVAAV